MFVVVTKRECIVYNAKQYFQKLCILKNHCLALKKIVQPLKEIVQLLSRNLYVCYEERPCIERGFAVVEDHQSSEEFCFAELKMPVGGTQECSVVNSCTCDWKGR